MLKWLIRYVRGYTAVQVTGAYPERFANVLSKEGIPFWNLHRKGKALRLNIFTRDQKRTASLADPDNQILFDPQKGMSKSLRVFRGRELLITGLALAVLFLMFSNSVILRIEIEGNVSVTDAEILAALRDLGVDIGTVCRTVHSQWLKPRILLRIPELSWFYINITGSVATVSVRERTEAPKILDEDLTMDVLAGKSGIVKKIEVYRGTAKIDVGDTVLEGDILISARVESPFAGERYVNAAGKVYCDTWYTVTIDLPLVVYEKQYSGHDKTIFDLIFSGRRINLTILSGIPYEFYDKIQLKRQIVLPGGYPLPFIIEKTVVSEYNLSEVRLAAATAELSAKKALTDLLKETVGSGGRVESVRILSSQTESVLSLTLYAHCFEEITAK